MGDKIDKVKLHLKNNYKTYIVGGVCLIVGALAAGAILSNRDEAA